MRIAVDRDRCCGSGNCVLALPEVFDQDDADGLVVLRQPEPSDEFIAQVEQAMESCPTGAISVPPDDLLN